MNEPGEITIVNHENTVPRIISFVNSDRVNHYDDALIGKIAEQEVRRFEKENGFLPDQSQIDFLKKEIVRYAVIRRDVKKAMELRIPKSNKLYETA